MCAYWARLRPVESVVAPMSRSVNGPLSVIIWTASAGRSTPGRRLRFRIADATPAPVWPAVTTASASPSRTRRMQTLMLASRLRRTATAACSSMPTASDAMTMRTCVGQRPVEMGADALLVADEDEVGVVVVAGPVDRAAHDLLGRVVATHGVDRDARSQGVDAVRRDG